MRCNQESRGGMRSCGADQQNMGRLFEPFYTTKPEGLGMGLRISRSIIEAHGSRLCAALNVGPQITVQFTLPIADRAATSVKGHA
jgi:signal transduction histidine kinase